MSAFDITGHVYNGVALNLYGDRDEDECIVERVTVADSEIDISELLSPADLCALADQADRKLDADWRESRGDARISRYEADHALDWSQEWLDTMQAAFAPVAVA